MSVSEKFTDQPGIEPGTYAIPGNMPFSWGKSTAWPLHSQNTASAYATDQEGFKSPYSQLFHPKTQRGIQVDYSMISPQDKTAPESTIYIITNASNVLISKLD